MVDSRKVKPELRPINSLCERWVGDASKINLGVNKLTMWDGEPSTRGMEVMPDDVAVLDKVLAKSDRYYKEFLIIWYGQDTPIEVKARQIGLKHRRVYNEWNSVLYYLLGRVHGEGLDI